MIRLLDFPIEDQGGFVVRLAKGVVLGLILFSSLFCCKTEAQISFHITLGTGAAPSEDDSGHARYWEVRRESFNRDCDALKKLLAVQELEVKIKTGYLFDFLAVYGWGNILASYDQCYGELKKYLPVGLERGGKRGFLYYDGSLMVEPKYDSTFLFRDGLAGVKLDGKWGFIDRNGTEIIPPRFTEANPFYENLAAVKVESGWGFIGLDGKWVAAPKYEYAYSFGEGRAAVEAGGLWGYIDRTGKVVIPIEYERAHYFNEDSKLAGVRRGGKWAYIDKKGNLVSPFKYDTTRPFASGFAVVGAGGKYGYVDRNGKELVPLKYDYAQDFFGEKACVMRDGKWRILDREGREHWRFLNWPCTK